MTDLISREKAIHELRRTLFKYEDENEEKYINNKKVDEWFGLVRPSVQDMNDLDVQTLVNLPSESPWHTGTPTEEGRFYAVICKGWGRPFNRLALVDDGKIYCLDDASDFEDFPHEIVKYREVWQFKGNQEKSEEISPNSEET